MALSTIADCSRELPNGAVLIRGKIRAFSSIFAAFISTQTSSSVRMLSEILVRKFVK